MEGELEFVQELTSLRPRLFARARRMLRSRENAEDLVQTTMLKAWERRGQFTPGTNIYAWSCAILRNSYIDELRKQRLEYHETIDDPYNPVALPVPATQEQHQLFLEICKVLDKIPASFRQAIILMLVHRYEYNEAADMLGVQVGTLKSRVNRGRVSILKWLKLGDWAEMMDSENV